MPLTRLALKTRATMTDQFPDATKMVPTTRLYSYSVGPAKPLDELGQGHTLVSPEPASAEAQGFAILSWSEERQPCEECRYNHCIAETPFGRFLISWKGWEEHSAVTADETPFGDWFECWNSVEEAKSGCQSEYNRRLALVPLPQLQPEPHPASPKAQPAGLVERVAARIEFGIDANQDPEGIARAVIREQAAWLRKNDSECQMGGDAAATAELLEQEADQ
jgi:hypothetical protein